MMIQGEKKIVVRTGSGSPKYAVTLVSRSSARQRFINYCGNRIKHTKQFGMKLIPETEGGSADDLHRIPEGRHRKRADAR